MKAIKRIKEIGLKRTLKKATAYDEVYAVGIRKYHSSDNDRIDTSASFSVLPEQRDMWMADPLIFTHEGKDWLFVETFSKRTHRGSISVIDLNNNTNAYAPVPVIEEPYHMSFPMIFTWSNEYYMIPETSENHSVNIYKCEDFPYKWSLAHSFSTDKLIVDSVITEKHENSISLLASESSAGNPLLVRFIRYTISNINGAWEIRFEPNESADFTLDQRNGGTPLHMKNNSRCYITQTSTAVDYGVSVSVSDIENNHVSPIQTLDSHTVKISGIKASDIIGIHTYSHGVQYEVIDLRYLKFDPLLNVRRIAYLFGK